MINKWPQIIGCKLQVYSEFFFQACLYLEKFNEHAWLFFECTQHATSIYHRQITVYTYTVVFVADYSSMNIEQILFG